MPLVTQTLRNRKPPEFKTAVLDAVRDALVASGVREKGRFHRLLGLGTDDLRFDATSPDLATPGPRSSS